MRLLLIGATGDVGQGVLAAAVARGWQVAVVGRDAARLAAVTRRLDPAGNVRALVGDIANEAGAAAVREAAVQALGQLDAVVTSVNVPMQLRSLFEWTAEELSDILQGNLLTHYNAAKALVPCIAAGGTYLAIGGGMADFLVLGGGHISMAQAAQRMMVRAIAKEHRGHDLHVRELLIQSMVNGERRRAEALPEWLTDAQIGEHVAAILAEPEAFPGPILTLKPGDPIGRPG